MVKRRKATVERVKSHESIERARIVSYCKNPAEKAERAPEKAARHADRQLRQLPVPDAAPVLKVGIKR